MWLRPIEQEKERPERETETPLGRKEGIEKPSSTMLKVNVQAEKQESVGVGGAEQSKRVQSCAKLKASKWGQGRGSGAGVCWSLADRFRL